METLLADKLLEKSNRYTCGGCANFIAVFPVIKGVKRYAATCKRGLLQQSFKLDSKSQSIQQALIDRGKICINLPIPQYERNWDDSTWKINT